MNFKNMMAPAMLVGSLLFSIGALNASVIAPGAAGAPTMFSGGAETLLTSISGTYSNSQESGSYRAAVYRTVGGTLDFVYDFNEDATGQLSALTSTTMSMFAGVSTDVMFVVNATSLIAPGNGFGVPANVTRSADGNVVKFFFPVLGVGADQASDTLIIRTNATNYTTGFYSIQDGQTSNLQGFQPSLVPEPGLAVMLGSALVGLAFLARRRRTA